MRDMDVIIIGGGISGLAALHWLSKRGARALLLERNIQVGGVIGSRRNALGALVELGPNSTQLNMPHLTEIIDDLDLEPSIMRSGAEAANRYIMRDGELVAAPTGPKALMTSELFTRGAKLRLLREPFIAAPRDGAEESIAEFVERRLGREVLDYAVNPFVSGIYAGRPERLSMRHSFPLLHELEQGSGSLFRGGIDRMRAKKKVKKRRKKDGIGEEQSQKGMFSFVEGMGMLPAAIESRWRDRIVRGIAAEKIEPVAGGWRVTASGETFEARQLIIATEAYTAGALIAEHDPEAGAALQAIEYPPLAVASVLYKCDAIAHPLDGFGFLVPEVEKRNVLGVIFSSTLFPNRAPSGTVLLTAFVGGARQPELALRVREEIEFDLHSELRRSLGISARPLAFDLNVIMRSIPQYNLGYGDTLDAIARAEERFPNLHLLGNYRGGVSVGDCVRHGAELAKRISGGKGDERAEVDESDELIPANDENDEIGTMNDEHEKDLASLSPIVNRRS